LRPKVAMEVAMESWFHDPVGNRVEKAGGHDGCAGMVLHGDHRGFGVERAIRIAQPQNVGELQWRGAGKQHFARSAEFDDRAFFDSCLDGCLDARPDARGARMTVVIRRFATRELNWNADRCGFGEKTGQLGDRAGLRRPRLSCALLPQAIPILSRHRLPVRTPDGHHRLELRLPEGGGIEEAAGFLPGKNAVGLPLFPVRKSVGEPERAVTAERDARPGPQCRTEGLALRS